MKPMPIEPIEKIPAQPDAALPILKHRIEARVGKALFLSIGRHRGWPETNQPLPNHANPQIAFPIYQEGAHLGQFAGISQVTILVRED